LDTPCEDNGQIQRTRFHGRIHFREKDDVPWVCDFKIYSILASHSEYQTYRFCEICGVAIRERFVAPEREHGTALNVRTMNGVDLAAFPIKKNNGKAGGVPYEV
jgi:hypothetical protein